VKKNDVRDPWLVSASLCALMAACSSDSLKNSDDLDASLGSGGSSGGTHGTGGSPGAGGSAAGASGGASAAGGHSAAGAPGSGGTSMGGAPGSGGTPEGAGGTESQCVPYFSHGEQGVSIVTADGAVISRPVPCTFLEPPPPPLLPDGGREPFDPARVNVLVRTMFGAPSATVGHVASGAACTPRGGWYYSTGVSTTSMDGGADASPAGVHDAGALPAVLVLCPATCALTTSQPSSAVDIAYGCPTTQG
jgi:hypothetical protein